MRSFVSEKDAKLQIPWKQKVLWLLAPILALGIVASVIAYYLITGSGVLPEGLIQANGRIEGDHITVASKFAGRLAELKVREGDQVQASQILVVMDDAQARARVAHASAASAVLDVQIQSAEIVLAVLRKEVPLAIASADAELSSARDAVDKANAEEIQARRDAERMRVLVARGAVSSQRAEQAELVLTAASTVLSAARHAALRAESQLSNAKLGPDRIKVKESELTALRAQREQAEADLAEAQSVLADLVIRAPSAGVVVTRIRQEGEVVGAGSPLFDLVDLDMLYLKVYVPEVQIGKLRRGLPARIYTDAFPDTPFDATVRYISSRAEFTPKEVQTPDERVKLTYAVKLYLDKNPDHKLTPGLPADAVIRWKDGVAWVKPKW